MALDLITGHQGVAHISAEQISTINKAMMDGYGDNKVMRMKNGTLTQDGLIIEVATGYWRANGFDIEIQEAETVYIDPSSIGMSRIDNVYVELLQDIPTGAQRAEIVTIQGEEAASDPTAPDAPTSPYLNTDILLDVIPLASVTVTEGAMVLTDLTEDFDLVTPSELAATEAEISDIVNVYGAKNLIPYPYYRQSGYSHNNMTATYDEDGVLTVNKTTGSNTAFFDLARISDNFFILPNTKYILSMELENTTNTSVYVQTVSGTDIAAIRNKATGKYEVAFTTGSTVSTNVVALYWGTNIVETNAKVKVMLRLASIQDDTYVPYAKTNKELTTDTSNIKDSVSSISITGTTNTTGATIAEDTYFYLNGELVRSKADIASGATLTLNTNYEVTTAGGLNEVNSQLKDALNDLDTSVYHGNSVYLQLFQQSGWTQGIGTCFSKSNPTSFWNGAIVGDRILSAAELSAFANNHEFNSDNHYIRIYTTNSTIAALNGKFIRLDF